MSGHTEFTNRSEDSRPRVNGLEALFYPKSVAVIGASENPTKIGGRPILHLKQAGFAGPIYPINPTHAEVQGLPAFASVTDVPGEIDLAIVAVPPAAVLDAVRACANHGVKVSVIFSAGFAELGAEGERAQEQMKAIAESAGMRILGPNCLGAANNRAGVIASFAFAVQLKKDDGPLLRIALVSQSGAVGAVSVAMSFQRAIEFDPWVSTGNEADIDVADCIAHLAQDEEVSAIAVYFEGCRDGERLRQALAIAAERGIPIVLLKAGETDVGARAAISHTASLVGSNEAYNALFQQYGVCRVSSISELVNVSQALALGAQPTGPRVGILTGSGGMGILAADAAVKLGLDVAPLSVKAQARLKEIWAPAGVSNPIDTTAQVTNDPNLLSSFIDVVTEEDYDTIVVLLQYSGMKAPWSDVVTGALARWREAHPEANLLLAILASPDVRRTITDLHIPVYDELMDAVSVAAALSRLGGARERSLNRVAATFAPAPRFDLSEPLTEQSAKRILAEAGVPTVGDLLVTSAAEAGTAGEKLGFPVSMKIVSPDITHKTEAGGVVLNVASVVEANEAYDRILDAVRTYAPSASIRGALVSPMVRGGTETILGVKIDPSLGPLVVFGLGGVFVEVLGDVSYRLAPFDEDEAIRMVREIKGFKVLDGARGRPKADVSALAKALSRLSVFAATNADRIESIDINPFVVLSEGEGALALDALIVPVK
jgi:acyl-CoA synthetase (NDP forming)